MVTFDDLATRIQTQAQNLRLRLGARDAGRTTVCAERGVCAWAVPAVTAVERTTRTHTSVFELPCAAEASIPTTGMC
jgi:hypothetical protein